MLVCGFYHYTLCRRTIPVAYGLLFKPAFIAISLVERLSFIKVFLYHSIVMSSEFNFAETIFLKKSTANYKNSALIKIYNFNTIILRFY
ncbi:MAG: hypothetical protein LBD19_04035 [Endomicrobium sp.]|nr:hypothetical protein [Endomicrobium sp.]